MRKKEKDPQTQSHRVNFVDYSFSHSLPECFPYPYREGEKQGNNENHCQFELPGANDKEPLCNLIMHQAVHSTGSPSSVAVR